MIAVETLTPDDAKELTRLLVANREAHAPFKPARPDGYFTVEGQREPRSSEHLYGIIEDDVLVGVVTLSTVVRGPFQSATVGYWVDEARRGRGVATRAVGAVAELAFGELGLHRLEAATLVDNVASQRVLEKNRFDKIGVAPQLPPRSRAHGKTTCSSSGRLRREIHQHISLEPVSTTYFSNELDC